MNKSLPGRPNLPFENKAIDSQKREAAALSRKGRNCKEQCSDTTKLLMAAQHSAKPSGKKDLMTLLSEIRRMLFQPNVSSYTPEEALSLILESSLSKDQYMSIRSGAKGKGADIFPSYNRVTEVKMECRPARECIVVTESAAEVELQALLDHTASRICAVQSDMIIESMKRSNVTEGNVTLVCSYGFDGSSGHSSYKQKCESDIETSDEKLFVTTLIPLRMIYRQGFVLWNNRTPQSPRFCRPLKLQYHKESEQLVKAEKLSLDEKISALRDFRIDFGSGFAICVNYALFLTLIDGKILNYLTNTKSAQSFPICHATPKTFYDLTNIDKEVSTPDPNSLLYGISPLHSWIRIFECCLPISYRLGVNPPAWQVRTAAQKESFASRKLHIQQELWKHMSLKVDRSKHGGSGTSNDGNTARRAFREPDTFANILGLDTQLVTNFQTISISLSSQLPLDPKLFSNFCHSTADLYISKYKWFSMPATVHKILIHAAQIIVNSVLPVGMLGEDAAEAMNTHYREFRLYHARKFSRKANLEDIFHRTLDSSDPLISSITINTRATKLKVIPLPLAVTSLLSIPSDVATDWDDRDAEQEDVSGFKETMTHLDELSLSDVDD